MHEAAERWVTLVSEAAVRLGTDDEFLYHNFAGSFQRPLATYGFDSMQFMRKVAQEFDPDGFFQRRMPGGFKLGYEADSSRGLHVQP